MPKRYAALPTAVASPHKGHLRRTRDISPQQMREARTALDWSRERLGAMSEVSANFIAIYEKSGRAMAHCPSALHADQLAQVRIALVAAGVEFLGPNESGATIRLVPAPRTDAHDDERAPR